MGDQIATAATFVQKGGVGKTTTTGHLGAAFAIDQDLDVILIDLAGSQNDLAAQFGVVDEANRKARKRPISSVFSNEWAQVERGIENDPDVESAADEMSIATGEGPDLIPADEGVQSKVTALGNRPPEERYGDMEAFVEDHLAPHYDVALFDLPGATQNVAQSAIAAADHVIAPASPGEFEREQLEYLEEDLRHFRETTPWDANLSLVIPTRVKRNRVLDREFIEFVDDEYGDRAGALIRESAEIQQRQDEGQTVIDANPFDLTDTATEAREAYLENAATLREWFEV